MEFSNLYQLLRSLVKRKFYWRGPNLGLREAILVIILLAVPLQQGQCLTAEEVAYLKKLGVSDKTIQRMIQQENEERRHSQTGIWEVEDERGNRSTIYHVGNDDESLERERVEQEKLDRAWEMLKNLIIDAREEE